MSLSRQFLESIIHRNPLTFSPQTSVQEAMLAMSELGTSCVLAVDQQKLAGILTERDIVRAMSYQASLDSTQIVDLMSSEVITLKSTQIKTIFQLTQLFQQHQIRHLPILNPQEQLLGVVTPDSIRNQLRPEYLLRYIKVMEVMVSKVVTAQLEMTLLAVTQLMMLHRVSCVVIVDDAVETPVGIITERDIVQFSSLDLNFAQVSAQTVMSTPLSTVEPTDSLWRVHSLMRQMRVRRLVVTNEQGDLIGIVTQSQVLKMCDPKELHYVVKTMQRVISRQTQELQQLNQALEQKNAELRQLANYDDLTKIANRRYFNVNLRKEWRRLMREGKPLSLIMGDIDQFKAFNDTYGHVAGDRCLRQIANLLKQTVQRPQDLVARYGGEEFVILLPDTDAAGAEHMAQTVLHTLGQLRIPHMGALNRQHVSLSLGVVTAVPTANRTSEDLLQAVDNLLYQAKDQGGDTYAFRAMI